MIKTKQDFLNAAQPFSQDIIDYAMSLSSPKASAVTGVKISISVEQSNEFDVENGIPAKLNYGEEIAVGVRLYSGNRSIDVQHSGMDILALKKAIKDNQGLLSFIPENLEKTLPKPSEIYTGQVNDLDLFDHSTPNDNELLDYSIRLEQAARSGKNIKELREVGTNKSVSFGYIQATNGIRISNSETTYSAGASCIAEGQKGDMCTGSEGAHVRYFSDMPSPEDIGRMAHENATSKLGGKTPDTGKVPLILGPQASTQFFIMLYGVINGAAIFKGQSFGTAKLGQQIFSPSITLLDDPLIKRGVNSQFLDSTGYQSKPITFIENGILKEYNMTLASARSLNRDPIGRSNGRTNAIILPGQHNPDDMMSDIKDGIYIESFSGGQASVSDGNFSKQANGFAIKNGQKTTQALSGFAVSGNLKDMFKTVILANDTPQLPNPYRSFASPTARLDNMMISGR